MTHYLKISPEYFEDVQKMRKNFEVRKDDRNYQVGDILVLQEHQGEGGDYTGRSEIVRVTYILRGGYCKDGYCIMSIEPFGNEHYDIEVFNHTVEMNHDLSLESTKIFKANQLFAQQLAEYILVTKAYEVEGERCLISNQDIYHYKAIIGRKKVPAFPVINPYTVERRKNDT